MTKVTHFAGMAGLFVAVACSGSDDRGESFGGFAGSCGKDSPCPEPPRAGAGNESDVGNAEAVAGGGGTASGDQGKGGDTSAGGATNTGSGGATNAGGETNAGGATNTGGATNAGGDTNAGGATNDPCPWASDCYQRLDACRASGAEGCDDLVATCDDLAARCSVSPPQTPQDCFHNADICYSKYDDCLAFTNGSDCIRIIEICADLERSCSGGAPG